MSSCPWYNNNNIYCSYSDGQIALCHSATMGFCDTPFWNSSLLLDNTWPEFTACFLHTILVWVPCGYVWLLLPYFLYDVNNPYSTNSLHIPANEKPRFHGNSSAWHAKIVANGSPITISEKVPLGALTPVCALKMILTCLLAVLHLIQLLLHFKEGNTPAQIVASAVYLCTYILVAFELWYEQRKGRNAMFMSFYFYFMNTVVGVVFVCTWILTEDYLYNKFNFGVVVCSFVINFVTFLICFLPDSNWNFGKKGYDKIGQKICPEVLASYPSKILFLWMRKLMMTGFRREIAADDLWDLNPRDQGRRVNHSFHDLWETELKRVQKINRENHVHQNGLNKRNSQVFGHHQNNRLYNRHLSHDIDAASVVFTSTNERTSLLIAEDLKLSVSEAPNSDAKPASPNLFLVLMKLLWKNASLALMQKICSDVILFLGPIILGALIEQLEFPNEERVWRAYTLSIGLFVTGVLRSILFSNSMHNACIVAIHIKSALISAIYKKALTISSSAKKGSTVGEIVNLMSVDCQRLQEVLTLFFFLWTTPVQLAISVVLLYNTIGLSVLTGIVLLLLLVPVNIWVGNQQKKFQETLLLLKDARIKMVNEILNGMKVLKLYAWEDEFKRKVEISRDLEIKELLKIALLYVLAGICWGMAPFLVGFVTFATYVLSDRSNALDPQKAFVCLALFNLMKIPLFYVSTLITYTVQTVVSVQRINKFLITEDLDFSNTKRDKKAEYAISIKDCTFTWDKDLRPTLKKINLTIAVGQLTAIVGPVGSGKTSLISAILGEMEKQRGQVTVKGKVAYVSQQAWIQNATVRNNILFGKKYNKHRYAQVIKACELERDLEILDAGDQTEIGEKGINLSGGQKQRINLARAVYSDSDVYLFDDPLSAVDAHVGKAIFKNVMGRKGVLANKTRILVTHGVHWLPQVEEIIVLYNGSISEHGSYEDLVSHNGPFAQFLQVYLKETNSDSGDGNSDNNEDDDLKAVKETMRTVVERLTSDTGNTSADEFTYFTKPDWLVKQGRIRKQPSESRLSEPILIHESLDLSTTLTSTVKALHPVGGKLILDEKLETGKVKSDVFVTYGNAAGMWAMLVAFLCYALNQGFSVWSSFFLTEWTEDSLLLNVSTRTTPEGYKRLDYYLFMYGGVFSVTQLITFIIFNYIFWYRMVRAAKTLHHLLLDRLFHAPMTFFDQTPIGRILNRFSKDVDTVDNALPLIMRDWILVTSMIVVTLIVVLIQTPIFAAVLVPLIILFYAIQNYYVRTSRQLKRIESITRSPIYVHFSESITGAAVIRAYGATDRFIIESESRVDKNQVYFFASQAAIRWLQLNMDVIATLVVMFAAIFQITSGGGGSDAGLSVSYALQIAGSLTYMVRQICEFETNIVSVERMREYSQVEQEAALINPLKRPSPTWPDKGDVIFTDYKTRYREGLELVLKGVKCSISGGEKIGIVGRTGAGKSSLTLCLFRIIEPVSGAITIDGINIADIGLHDLRSKLTILPQDPVLFSGSLRMNIDPFEQYSDEQLWTALERSYLKDFITAQPDQLMYECGEEGANLSVGQRQLVCLARALLRHTKILILDEATAAIDMETDALIQKTIREAFSECTILAIAHRLNTVMDYDRIVVMDAGIICEFDSPENLIRSKGVFYGMCKNAGLV